MSARTLFLRAGAATRGTGSTLINVPNNIIHSLPRRSTKFSTTRAFTSLHRPSPSSILTTPISRCNFKPLPQFAKQQFRHYRPKPTPTPGGSKNKETLFAFAGIFILGSGLFYLLVQQRKNQPHTPAFENMKQEKAAHAAAQAGKKDSQDDGESAEPHPYFDDNEVTVIFVLGGPGVGKGTQCSLLTIRHNFNHLSAGDLLRAEQTRPGSQYGELIRTHIREGKIVPMEVTVALLQNAMEEIINKAKSEGKTQSQYHFLIDGFPRKLDQAHKFEDTVCRSKLVLFFDTSEEVMMQRLLKRGETSGRDDDNLESIRKRFRTFVETSMPVVEYYEGLNRVVRVDASREVEGVYQDVVKELEERKVL